jgi:two-component SAPR family response regulator
MHVAQHYTEYIKQAKAAEKEGEEEEAITFYQRAIKQKPLLEQP